MVRSVQRKSAGSAKSIAKDTGRSCPWSFSCFCCYIFWDDFLDLFITPFKLFKKPIEKRRKINDSNRTFPISNRLTMGQTMMRHKISMRVALCVRADLTTVRWRSGDSQVRRRDQTFYLDARDFYLISHIIWLKKFGSRFIWIISYSHNFIPVSTSKSDSRKEMKSRHDRTIQERPINRFES